jgi:hypothetical protein
VSTWTDIRDKLETILPYAVGALGGPAGPAIGGILAAALGTSNTPPAVNTALATDPNAAAKILQYEAQLQTVVINQQVADHAADVEQVKAVNATMQTEDANKVHWRNVFGYEFGVCFTLYVLAIVSAALWFPTNAVNDLVTIGATLVTLFGYAAAILGVTAWHDGATKRIAAGDTSLSAALAELVKK